MGKCVPGLPLWTQAPPSIQVAVDEAQQPGRPPHWMAVLSRLNVTEGDGTPPNALSALTSTPGPDAPGSGGCPPGPACGTLVSVQLA